MNKGWIGVALLWGLAGPAAAAPTREDYLEGIHRDLVEVEATLSELERFVREQDARMETPAPISLPKSAPGREMLEQAQAKLDRAARVAWKGDLRVPELQARMEEAKRADARVRAALALETRLRPDAYAGGDATELKGFAGQVVSGAHPDAVLLRTVLVSSGWTEEEVLGWMDESQMDMTASVLRRLSAEVAGRINANTRLYLVNMWQERLPEGRWGPLQGTVWHSIPMLEENAKQGGR